MIVTHKVQIWAGWVLGLSASMITLTWEKEKAKGLEPKHGWVAGRTQR